MDLQESIVGLSARLSADRDLRSAIGCNFSLRVGQKSWRFKCRDKFEIEEGQLSSDVTLICSEGDLVELLQGELNSQEAFLEHRLKIEGDYHCALNLFRMFDGSFAHGTK